MQKIVQADVVESLPEGLRLSSFTELTDSELPWIWRDGDVLSIPVLVRAFPPPNEGEEGLFRYYEVRMPWLGRSFRSYRDWCIGCYSDIRRHFYGTPEFEAGLRDDYRWTAHMLAVKTAFPKYPGETQEGIARYSALKTAFWTSVDAALATVGKTRDDLPPSFTGEWMLTQAKEWGMSDELIAQMTLFMETLSLNLLHNGRNWSELFM